MKRRSLILLLSVTLLFSSDLTAQKRDMTFLDNLTRPRASNPSLSHDGTQAVYTIGATDWDSRKRYSDIWVTDIASGKIRQMTFTDDKNESSPKFTPDGQGILFLSNRSGKNHLYYMRLDGGEARLLTKDNKDGVGNFQFSNDDSKLVYSSKVKEITQLWIMNSDLSGKAEKLTDHKSSVGRWNWSKDDMSIYFLAGDEDNVIARKRSKLTFNADLKSEMGIASHLWKVSIASKDETAITNDKKFSDTNYVLSNDGKWIGVTRQPYKRYTNPYDASPYRELILINAATGKEEQLTNQLAGKNGFSFSHDSKFILYSMNDDGVYQRNQKIYVRPIDGGNWKKLMPNEDVSLKGGFTMDGKIFYVTIGEGVRQNVFTTTGDKLKRVTDTQGSVSANYDEKTGKVIVSFSDPYLPSDYYVTDLKNLGKQDKWVKITDSDPEVRNFNLSKAETVTWKSKDGTTVEGILYTPHDYDPNRKYPLIVQVHGGPASASMRRFTTGHGYYVHTLTANDYTVLMPNYRGSDNYGEKFRMEIAGNYFQRGYEDIIAGVDYLIERGVAHPDSLGHMGWSAGGHWSNWALVSTDRYKAISSGAGGMNWVSMYAQTDVQAPREFYFEGTPYDNFDGFWDVSPLKFIKNAKTPTLVHVVKGDPRVPAPQSQELYMALQKLGVPSEYFEYPGNAHGIREVRYQMVKMYSEYMWFEKWIRGNDGWFDWEDIIKMVEKDKK